MHVMRHETLFAARHIEPLPMGKRIANVFEATFSVLAHRIDAELVVLVMPLVRLVLIDEVHHIDRATVGRFFRQPEQRIGLAQYITDSVPADAPATARLTSWSNPPELDSYPGKI
jgi:hypothetical protein